MTPVHNAQQAIPILCPVTFSTRTCLVGLKIGHGVNGANFQQECKCVLYRNGSSCTNGKIFASAPLQLLFQNLLPYAIYIYTHTRASARARTHTQNLILALHVNGHLWWALFIFYFTMGCGTYKAEEQRKHGLGGETRSKETILKIEVKTENIFNRF